MKQKKFYSDEMLKEYISSEIELIKKERENDSSWKINEEYHSQIEIEVVGD